MKQTSLFWILIKHIAADLTYFKWSMFKNDISYYEDCGKSQKPIEIRVSSPKKQVYFNNSYLKASSHIYRK